MQRVDVRRAASAAVTLAGLFLSACGGGGSEAGIGFPEEPTSPGGSTKPIVLDASSNVAQRCASPRSTDRRSTIDIEKAWVRSWIDETYLWYRDVQALPAYVLNSSGYATATDYFYALRSPATTPSGKPRDAYHFTQDTAAWLAASQSGIAYGYGAMIDLPSTRPPRSAVVVSTQPGSQASAAGIVRGTQLLTVDGVDLVNDETAAGVDALNAALFPSSASTHTFTVLDPGAAAPRTVTLTASAITETPVSNVKTLPAPYQSVGYLQFDAHIATAEGLLIDAINQLKTAGVTDLVLDLRYNGGGYLDIASQLAYMVAGPTRTAGRVFETLAFNDKNPFQLTVAEATTPFHTTSQGFSVDGGRPLPWLGLSRVFVIATGGTCSASEAIVNGLRGVGVEVVLIGGTTCGKPYGFFPKDNCSTTYFAVQFKGVNALGFGDYADGFAPSCAGSDDYNHALGDPAEGLLAVALARRDTGVCIAAGSASGRKRAQSASTLAPTGPELQRPPARVNSIYRTR